jgi:hypothetical protein
MQPYEIIMAPYEVWLAPIGEAFPDVDETPGGNWELLGTNGVKNYSEDGVTVTHEQTLEAHRTLGTTGPVKVKRTEESLMVELILEDLSMEHYAKVLNDVVVTDTPAASGTPGHRDITLRQGSEVATFAALVRGPSPYADNMAAQYQIPRVYQGANPAPVFTKGEAAGLQAQFIALEDPNASTDEERFGKLVAQDAAAL